MTAHHTIAKWNGLDVQVSARMSRTPGLVPDRGELVWRKGGVQPTSPNGTLEFFHNGTRFDYFEGCRLTSSTETRSGYIDIKYSVEDRRWKWPFATISGSYNVRDSKKYVVSSTEKTARELVNLILTDGLKETGYDSSVIPDTLEVRPEVRWHFSNCVQELGKILALYGCDLHFNDAGKVVIYRKGVGAVPSFAGATRIPDYGITVPKAPDAVRCVSAPSLYEGWILLKPIGYEVDITATFDALSGDSAEIRALTSLSYAPPEGFTDLVTFANVDDYVKGLGVTDVRKRNKIIQLCKQTVMRTYEVDPKTIWTGREDALSVVTVTDKRNILPLIPTRLVSHQESLGVRKPAGAEIIGFWRDDRRGSTREAESMIWDKGFSVSAETGIVTLSEPAWREVDDGSGGKTRLPAVLLLRCGHVLRQSPYGPEAVRGWTVSTGYTNGTEVEILKREDLQVMYIQQYSGEYSVTLDPTNKPILGKTSVANTEPMIDAELSATIGNRVVNYTVAPQPLTVEYCPPRLFLTNGVVNQVTIACGRKGFGQSTVTLWGEHDLSQPPQVQKQRTALLAAQQKEGLSTIAADGLKQKDYLTERQYKLELTSTGG